LTSSWNRVSDWTEFQPGAQKRGISPGGGCPWYPSIEKTKGVSGSLGGTGSKTLSRAWIAVRPLARMCSRAIFIPGIGRKSARGAASIAPASAGILAESSAVTSS
jgi:hypothetical protein